MDKEKIIFLARIFLALLFIITGYEKVIGFQNTVSSIQGLGSLFSTFATLLALGAIVFEIAGGLMVLIGWKTKVGSAMLMIFLILATLMYHIGEGHLHPFLSNLAVLGGLMLIYVCGPGDYSMDKKKNGK